MKKEDSTREQGVEDHEGEGREREKGLRGKERERKGLRGKEGERKGLDEKESIMQISISEN